MLERLWRQRRRLVLTFILCGLTGFILADGGVLASIANTVELGLLGVILTAAMLLALPDARWFVFKLAALAPVFALLALALPGALVLVLYAAAAIALPSHPWALDRIRLPIIFRARDEARIALPKERVWDRVYPRETNEHWDPFLRSIRSGRSDDTFFLVYEALSRSGELQVPIRVFDVEPGVHFKTRDLSLPDAAEGGPVTVTSHVVESDGDGTSLILMEATWRPMLWTAFSQWLDDYLGDHVDRLAALLEGRPDWSLKGASLRTFVTRVQADPFEMFQRS
ncbi:MAG: hypothetical protein AAFN27_09045 [Pseudomonadota bacterium]